MSVRQLQNLSEPWFTCIHKGDYKDICLPGSLWNINERVYVKVPSPRPLCKVLFHECFCGHSNRKYNAPFIGAGAGSIFYIETSHSIANIHLYFLQTCQKIWHSKKMCSVCIMALEILHHPCLPPQLGPHPSRLLFFGRKKSNRCSIRVLHLSGNSPLQAFAHAVTSTGTLPPAPITPSLFTPSSSSFQLRPHLY